MNENLKIASANIRSLKKIEKILYLHDICEKNNIDILFIQETHLNEVIFQNEIKKVFKNYICYLPILPTSYKGVGVLIKNNNNIHQINHEIIDTNRIIITKLNINDTFINLVNIYSPNSTNERMDFINILYETLIYKKNIILVGDFNHNILTSNRKKSITKQWIDLFKNISLQEFHFNEKINESSCTWSNEISSTRIDRIYYSKDLKEKFDFKYNNLLVNIFSDHKIVIADIIF
jgi:exonuclease III